MKSLNEHSKALLPLSPNVRLVSAMQAYLRIRMHWVSSVVLPWMKCSVYNAQKKGHAKECEENVKYK